MAPSRAGLAAWQTAERAMRNAQQPAHLYRSPLRASLDTMQRNGRQG